MTYWRGLLIPEEATLVERAKGGSIAAYEELVRGHQAVAFRTAFTITGDASEAEDAAQEAFMKVYRILDRFRPGAPFRPWLLTVVANEARNRRRAAGRRVGLTLRAAEYGSQTAAPPSPETTVVAEERRAELLGAVGGGPGSDLAPVLSGANGGGGRGRHGVRAGNRKVPALAGRR